MIRRVAFALILGGLLAPEVRAQVASTATPATVATPNPAPNPAPTPQATISAQPRPPVSDVALPPPTPALLPDRQPAAGPAPNQAGRGDNGNGRGKARRPAEAQGRFANPGGVGRSSEYYTPFTPMTGYPGPRIHPAAGFGQGGGPTRQEQIEAFRVGQYRTQNIQNNINAYGRPIGFGIGFGYGFGGLGGYR